MSPTDARSCIILIVLIFLSAFFSSAETALTTVNKLRIRTLADEGSKSAKILLKVIDDSGKMLSAILIGNNVVNISASALATLITQNIWGNEAVSIMTGVMTILILIFGEISPKTIATVYSESISLKYAPIIYGFMYICTPIIFIVNNLSLLFLKLLRVDKDAKKNTYTENELRAIVDVSHEEGVIEREEREMIKNVFDFGDAQAKDVMVPRIDMTMVDSNISYDELMSVFEKDRFTRIPVYENTSDNVIGIVNMKDLLFYDKSKPFHAGDYLREAFFTYEAKNLSELMLEMKKTSVNIIIVLDEYGATAGLITLEDLLEEIVGEIRDEYDEDEEDDVSQISEKEYLIDGQMKLDDFNEQFFTSYQSEDYDSVGGFVIEQLDKLPEEGDTLDLEDCTLIVQRLEKKRIEKIQVFFKDKQPAEEKKA